MVSGRKAMVCALICLIYATFASSQSNDFHTHPLPNGESTDATENVCGNIQYNALKERLLKNYDSSEELYRLFPFAKASSIPTFSRNNYSANIQGSGQECASLQTGANANGGSTCPGREVINRDVDRVPCEIKEKRCLCSHCLIPHSLQVRRNRSPCKPIYHYVPVMRRTTGLDNNDGIWTYTLEPVSVGCFCASASGRHIWSTRD